MAKILKIMNNAGDLDAPIDLLSQEWSAESMHWLLDVHFEEDWRRAEDKAVQQHLNMFRKAAISLTKLYKSRANSKESISGIMLEYLIDNSAILRGGEKLICV